jgi:hypothetical protein
MTWSGSRSRQDTLGGSVFNRQLLCLSPEKPVAHEKHLINEARNCETPLNSMNCFNLETGLLTRVDRFRDRVMGNLAAVFAARSRWNR